MKNKTNYAKSFSYEILLRYAFKLNERSLKKGADCSVYENLFHIENGINLVKGNTYEKQFSLVKTYLEKGLEALTKEKVFNTQEKADLKTLKLRLCNSYNEPQIASIVSEGLEIVTLHKEALSK